MRKFYLFLIITLLAISCSKQGKIQQNFQILQQQIQSKYAPDKSLAIAHFRLISKTGHWILKGETTKKEAKVEVLRKVDSLISGHVIDSTIVLPQPSLGDSVYGLVRISMANIRRQPRHAAELIDQSTTGDILKLLKRKGSWYLVQTSYDYIGWMTKSSFYRSTLKGVKDWQKSKRVVVTVSVGRIFTQPSQEAVPVCDVVLNGQLKLLKKQAKWSKVEIPDGRTGYILSAKIVSVKKGKAPKNVKPEQILNVAFQLMGIPYLWGGNTAKGCDCSGFTQNVFKANGIQLPRDARQQALEGKEIVPAKDFSNVDPGDLLFFGLGNRITHVGISLGGYRFIHQDSEVRLNSFNEHDEDFNPFRKKTLKKIKRILK